MAHYLEKELYDLIKRDDFIFDFLQSSSLDGLWYQDLENPQHEWMNAKFWTTLGYDPTAMPHFVTTWQDIIHPDDLQVALKNAYLHCEDPSHPYDQIVRCQHQNGSMVWIRRRGIAIRDNSGIPIRLLGTHINITKTKQAEQDAQASKAAYETILESQSTYIVKVSPEGRYTYANSAFYKAMNTTTDHIIGEPVLITVIPEDHAKCAEAAKFCLFHPNEPFYTTLRKRFEDGATRFSDWEFIGLPDSDGHVTEILGIGIDVSQRIQAEFEQQQLRNLLLEAQHIANLGSWDFDIPTQKMTWTDQVYTILEVAADFEPTGEKSLEFYHPDDRPRIEQALARTISEKKAFNIVCRIITGKHNLRWVKASGQPVTQDGEVTRIIGVFQDITEQKNTEFVLQTLLEEKTTLLKEIHHRVKNNLQVVASLLSLQARKLTDEDAQQALQGSYRRVLAMAEVHKALYESKSLSKIDFDVYLRELVDNICKSLSMPYIKVVYNLQPVVLTIEDAIPAALVVNELIANTCKHAFPNTILDPQIMVCLCCADGKVDLNVTDNGIGISAENTAPLEHSPDSFGMSIIEALTDQLRGDLDIARLEPNGTSATLCFPFREG
ncbi:MAG: PAS domain-containing protein [Deinococcota bacterium]